VEVILSTSILKVKMSPNSSQDIRQATSRESGQNNIEEPSGRYHCRDAV
jgi:hypothetical protein